MRKMLGVALLFLLLILPCFAADAPTPTPAPTDKPADTKKVLQGDFQVFKLGDTRKQVIRKIQEYINEGRTEFLAGEGNRIIIKPDNLPVTFQYQRNRLYMISILYEPGYKEIKERQELVKFLKDLLTQTYGQPAGNKGYPAKTEAAQVYPCTNWVLSGKNVDIVVRTDYRNYPEVTVEIYDPQIRAAEDKEMVKDFG